MRWNTLLPALSLAGAALAAPSKREILERKSEFVKNAIIEQDLARRQSAPDNSTASGGGSPGTIPMNITFSNPAASAFYVNGSAIPDVDFDVGPSCEWLHSSTLATLGVSKRRTPSNTWRLRNLDRGWTYANFQRS